MNSSQQPAASPRMNLKPSYRDFPTELEAPATPAKTFAYLRLHPRLICLELDRTLSGPREYLDLTRQILTDCGASIDSTRLKLVLEAALDVLTLFFAAALHEPTQPELHDLFEDFLMRCIVGYCTEEAR